MTGFDIVLRGGRVIDPESGLDAVRDVAIAGDRVARIGTALPPGRREADVAGQVVTAGFIDLHSHAGDTGGSRLQAMDGVTTALELEAGAAPVRAAYERAAAAGRPVNYGFAASWALARMAVLAGIPLDGSAATFFAHVASPAWQRAATAAETDRILARLEAGIADGALGIGVLAGYAPGASPGEYLRVAALAAKMGVPTFTHSRDLVEFTPRTLIDGAEEIVRAAGETGAHMHYCHVNSTTLRHADRVLALVERAQRAGARVSTEAYPYGAGMTGIGAAFLSPGRLGERGLTPASLTYAPTGERIASADRLRELRAADPGGLVVIQNLDEDDPADRAVLMRYLTFPGSVIASDAMPLTWAGPAPDPEAWPLPPSAFTHPRTAGTFARAIRMLTREGGPLGLSDALAKCSLLPARLLEAHVPAMRRKGRIAEGCDADIVVFDPAAITDQATYARPTRPSGGIRHVLVNGEFVVFGARLVTGARPGRPVRAGGGEIGSR
ncbi:MAG TPA: amidohydrolase family protein [Streptosporangiaceae bacterium]|nr:amidohydrolase family protein [Streptosporangiaceae bacterium]